MLSFEFENPPVSESPALTSPVPFVNSIYAAINALTPYILYLIFHEIFNKTGHNRTADSTKCINQSNNNSTEGIIKGQEISASGIFIDQGINTRQVGGGTQTLECRAGRQCL